MGLINISKNYKNKAIFNDMNITFPLAGHIEQYY